MARPWFRRAPFLGAAILGALAFGVCAWAAYAPLPPGSRELVYAIPRGHASRLGSGLESTLPSRVRLSVGFRDVLVLRNDDQIPASFGPVLLAPGQTYRVPFTVPGEIPFACSAHPDGRISLVVEPFPHPGWTRLSWRFADVLGP